MHSRYTFWSKISGEKTKQNNNNNNWTNGKNKTKDNFILSQQIEASSFSVESAPIVIFYLSQVVTETKGQTFRGIPGFHSTSDHTAVIFSAHIVAMKCDVLTKFY